MSKYIDADQLKAEIERLKQENAISDDKEYAQYELDVACGYDMALEKVLLMLSSLQQEQPECHTVEDWMQHIKNADQLTRDIFSKGPYDVLYDALNHPFLHCYNAIKEFGELCFQTGVKSVKQEQPVEIHIDNPNIQKFDPNIKVEIHTDGTGDIDGKAMLYVADKSYKIGFRDGKASKEQSVEGLEEEIERVCAEIEEKNPQHRGLKPSGIAKIARYFYELGCRHAAEMYDVIEYNRQMAEEKRSVDGLEEEIARYLREECSADDEPSISDIARHFAEWQKVQDQKTIELAEDQAMLAGMNKMEQQMMEKAVEIEVKEDAGGFPIVSLDAIELYDYENDKPLAKAGDKVRVIVIPNTDKK